MGAHVTLRPCCRKGRMISRQQEPSAHAPWTKTSVTFSSELAMLRTSSYRGGDTPFDHGTYRMDLLVSGIVVGSVTFIVGA